MSTPSWARDAVWYQIFPERFCNGDSRNDPTAATLERTDIHDWHISRWTRDWYALDPWEHQLGGFFKSVFHRRYGGDLQGIIERLDYLHDLGVTALYLTPVFWARSLHKYDGNAYHHVDPHFGPDPAGDKEMLATARETDDPATWVWTAADLLLLDLVEAAHRRNLRVILDGVFNHTGRDCFAFQDLRAHGQASRYTGWYEIERWDRSLPDGFAYKGWFGHRTLPELRKENGSLAAPVRDYIFNSTRRWMQPLVDGRARDGIDGWRLDVAFCVPHGFWKEWCAQVRQLNPQAYTVGEVVEVAPEYLQGDEFDALMNYPFLFGVAEFFSDRRDKISAGEFDRRMAALRHAYPPEHTAVMQNLLSSHDCVRFASAVMNPDRHYRDWGKYHHRTQVHNDVHYDLSPPRGDALARQKLGVLFQMTYPGAPMVYYGDEAGMWGANDPCNRKPMVWPAPTYDDEQGHPHHRPRTPDPVVFNHDLYAWYRRLIQLRRGSPALSHGDYTTLLADDARGVFVFARRGGHETAVVALNSSDTPHTVAWSAAWPPCAQPGRVLGLTVTPAVLTLPAFTGEIFFNV
jgi:glycosidase